MLHIIGTFLFDQVYDSYEMRRERKEIVERILIDSFQTAMAEFTERDWHQWQSWKSTHWDLFQTAKTKISKREKERNSVETVLIDPFPTVKTEKERESEKVCGMTSFNWHFQPDSIILIYLIVTRNRCKPTEHNECGCQAHQQQLFTVLVLTIIVKRKKIQNKLSRHKTGSND